MTRALISSCNVFANIETWLTFRWLTEDEKPRTFWEARASIIGECFEPDQAIHQLAKEILDSVNFDCRKNVENLAADLLNAALSEVVWCELARVLLDGKLPPPPVEALFPLGNIVATPGVMEHISDDERLKALQRHARADWGEIDREDWAANETALREERRLYSSYRAVGGRKFLIITECDRSATTLLLPEEY